GNNMANSTSSHNLSNGDWLGICGGGIQPCALCRIDAKPYDSHQCLVGTKFWKFTFNNFEMLGADRTFWPFAQNDLPVDDLHGSHSHGQSVIWAAYRNRIKPISAAFFISSTLSQAAIVAGELSGIGQLAGSGV